MYNAFEGEMIADAFEQSGDMQAVFMDKTEPK